MDVEFWLTVFFIFAPTAVLLAGPDDAVIHRLMSRQPLRTWHVETFAVMVLVAAVVVVSGGAPEEWCGWAALVFSHGRNSVGTRLAEAQVRSSSEHVDCHVWSRRYLLLAEACWAVYFIHHRSWAALCGVVVFAGYQAWRSWWRSRSRMGGRS